MRYDPIDPRFFVENRARLSAKMKPNALAILNSADVMPQSADGTMRFYQNSDIFYLSGVDQEESVLVLYPDAKNPADRAILFVRETSDLIKIWEGAKLTQEEAKKLSGVQNVQWLDRLEPELRRLMKQADAVYLNANEHARAAREVQTRDDRFRQHIQSLYPGRRYERLAPLLYELRQVKSDVEIKLIQHACDITEAGFRRVLEYVRPGVAEYQVEAELIHEFVQRRSRGFAYNPIVASGKNACVLHYLENDSICRDGDLLLMDVAAEYGRYNSDLTRTIPVNGKYTDRQRDVYNAVLRVFRACIEELLKPGIRIKEEYQPEVGKRMEEELLRLGLLDEKEVKEERAKDGTDDQVKEEDRLYRKYFMHGTSHSLGLDVHDVMPAEYKVQPGMVFTVEPGIYLPDEGFGVRLENDVLVTEEGNVDLMAKIPVEAEEIEELMAR